jgi:hypothetical protein
MESTNIPVRKKTSETKIGKVKYIVTSVFSETSRETADQKLLRLVSDRVCTEMKTGSGVFVGETT